jgi:hypothetical protein
MTTKREVKQYFKKLKWGDRADLMSELNDIDDKLTDKEEDNED